MIMPANKERVKKARFFALNLVYTNHFSELGER